MRDSAKATTLRERATRILRGKAVPLALMGAAIGLFVACSSLHNSVVIPPEIPGATFVGNQECELCHEDQVKKFAFSVHARVHVEDAPGGLAGCEACHGPGSKHVEAGGGRGVFIVNPGDSSDACYRCHLDKKAEFQLPYRHPVPEGKMSCADCHDPHGSDIKKPGSMLMARTNDTCASCHREQARSHVFDHEALRDGCTSCHAVHGSINKKMLVQADNSLCLKCHSQPQADHADLLIGGRNHSSFLTRGTCWSAGCHTAVHGSNTNAHLRY